ncbi:hypothetical protein E0Z10_g2737 [Xylaria hypoxylon]|uniref:Uncharacterized protein n=1 Tax=Xylaria hypoxylon TaxID=37992 RepID=A0A4Z0YPW2_9PEZI|nr:hypothetical protein E0Z10_g2737 [Xylaria hypoxylon]
MPKKHAMERHHDKFLKTVFRLRGLPYSVKTLDDVASLTSASLGDIPAHNVRVFSLASNLGFGDNSLSKVATLMLLTILSLVHDYKSNAEWNIPIQSPQPGHYLVLDTHFEGMTTMNDVDQLSHKYDDKTFMWIRDALPKHIHGIRAVIYGYETRLTGNQSIERIKDLASKLIALLTAYKWASRSSKPVIFLGHSLGGLVLRDALRQLADSSSEEYRALLNIIRGALFFGVPKLGIEQASLRAIVQGNPNETLIEDIGRGSNYLRRLNESFSHNLANEYFKQFWAYETLESPTTVRNPDDHINRNGSLAILVSRESATLRLIESNSSVTFPIKATHSDMVKFTRKSPDYHIVVSKISSIVNKGLHHRESYANHQAAELRTLQGVPSESNEDNITAQLELFRRLSGITMAEETKFLSVTFDMIQDTTRGIQMVQEERGSLMYMQRLEPILVSMKQFAEVSEAAEVVFGLANSMAYVWATSSHPDIFNCILDAYQEIGEQIPQLRAYQGRLATNQHLKHILVLIYSDLMWFHREVLQQLKQRAEQARHHKTRSICESPGAWLLADSRFKNWSTPEFCSDPFLWLNGIPGAGKTILASVVVDHLQLIPGAAVAYFYCKYGDESRASFIGIARAVLAQLLSQRPHLTSYFFEKATTSGRVLLDSTTTAREMIKAVLSSCENTYIVIDGVDECKRNDRDEIVDVFRRAIQDLPIEVPGIARCLFVSQDDDNARRNFCDLSTIKIIDESEDDLKDFAKKRHLALEAKFGPLQSKDCYVSKILVARAQGMFIFADLFAKYLEAQLSKAALLAELDPNKLPVTLDHVYERIVERMFEARDDSAVASVRKILGWITCARRPLKWVEVQGAVCVDLDNQIIDHDKMLSDSPKGLFASLIEIKEDNTVELVHETRGSNYLRKHVIDFREVHYSLAMVSIGYLTLPQLDMAGQKADEDVHLNLVKGTYSFHDYASACWAMHLQEGISELKVGGELTQLLETLETFIELHWSPTHKPLQDLKRV